MAVAGPESHKSNHKKHRKDKREKNIFSKSSSESDSDSVPEEHGASQSNLFKLPQYSGRVATSQAANGNVSDSETDIDKPPKKTVGHKSVGGTQNAKSYYNNNTQSAVQRYDEDEESDDEQQSMSLLQLQPAKISSVKKSNQSIANSSSKSDHKSLSQRDTLKSKVIRKPNIPEMSPSESEGDSDKETNHHHHSQPQQSESESEEEEEEEDEQENGQNEESRNIHHQHQQQQQQQQQQIVTALNSTVRIKEEVHSNSESSSFEEDDPAPLQEFQNIPQVPTQELRNISSQSVSVNPRGGVINMLHSTDAATFEQEHTRVSAPVIDIPQDSRVWVLQVPRSIKATHLHGQDLKKKLKDGEVLNLPSGNWQILEQPYEASRSALNCIVSTGTLCYGMRWLQPRGFWYLKQLRSPLPRETDDAPWLQEITPLPIKELLKMKSNPAISKDQHLKPSKKRRRDSDLHLASKRTKVIPEDVGIIHQLFMERKMKVRLFDNTSSIVDMEPSMMELSPKKDDSRHQKTKHHHGSYAEEESSIQGGVSEKGKKRKRSSDVNKESPKKKKKKNYSSEVDSQSDLERSRLQVADMPVTDVNRSFSSTTAENISFSKKEKKKSKHKDVCDDSGKTTSYPVNIANVKQEIATSDSEGIEHSAVHNSSGISSDKKHRKHKKSHVEQEGEDSYLEMKQESRETAEKAKKKKGKHKSNESDHGETFQAHSVAQETDKPIKEKKKHSQQAETSFEETDTEVRKKKKHKHHKNREESEVSFQETEKDIPVKKKKKHKHKESDGPKVKQEPFWDRETSPDFLSHLYLTQVTPEDK